MSIKNKVTGGIPNISTYDTGGVIIDISVPGNVTAANINGDHLTLTGNAVIAGNAVILGNLTYNDVNNITTSNLVISLGNTQTGVLVNGGGMILGNTAEASFLYNFATQSWDSNIGISAVGNVSGANIVTSGNVVAVGGITGESLAAAANITSGGNISGVYFVGNGSQLTGMYSNSNAAAFLPTYTGNLTAGNVVVTGNATAAYFIGDGSELTGLPPGYTDADVANYLPTYTGNLTAGNVVVSGNSTATYFVGDGSQLTGLPAGYANSDVANYLASNSDVVITTTGNITTTANISADYYIGNGSQLTGLPESYTNANVASFLPTYTGNLSSVTNITATGNVNANNFTAGSNIATANLSATTANIANLKATTANITGNLNVANLIASGTVAATNIGNITPVNLSGTVTQWLAGNGTWQTPPGFDELRNITKVVQSYGYGNQFILADGRLYITKSNGANNAWTSGLGDFGNGLFQGINNMYELPFLDESIGTIVDVGIYGYSAYALFANGNLYTWGYNGYGQLGLGNTTNQQFPVLSNTGVAQVYTDPSASQVPNPTRLVIRKTNNTFWGCGHDGQYQLGLGTNTNKLSWTAMPWIPSDVLSVWNLGGDLGCMFIQLANGNIQVTGWNGRGQLGVGNSTQPTVPVTANGWLAGDSTMRIQSIGWGGPYNGSGSQENYCNITLLLDNGSISIIRGAGDNNWGSLGTNNFTNSNVPVAPTTATGLTGRVAKLLSVGPAPKSLYALMTNGDLYGWGYNNYGQIATGGTAAQTAPYLITTDVLDIDGAVQGWDIAGYFTPSPFIKKSTGYFSSGFGAYGQLGNGTTNTNNVTLQRLRVPKEITFKFFGCFASNNEGLTRIGITEQNTIWAWGYNAYNSIDATNTASVIQPLQFTPNSIRT